MSQPIAGVSPSELLEVSCKVVWPTIGALRAGRFVGQLSGLRLGFGIFTVGNLLALATIPLSLVVFCWQLMPFVCRRYALTNRRIIVRKGLSAVDGPWISLDDFDAIKVDVLPGQAWLHAGDLVFLHHEHEVLRLAGVPRPETFRQVCLTAHTAHQSVRAVVERQASSAA
ncbi:MAG: hypothetical protein LLF97_07805 [Planctomycetaceae bacterium]|nr:hypothetical protein [Planctomycetaceae bacterium]